MDWEMLYCPNRQCRWYGISFRHRVPPHLTVVMLPPPAPVVSPLRRSAPALGGDPGRQRHLVAQQLEHRPAMVRQPGRHRRRALLPLPGAPTGARCRRLSCSQQKL